MFKKFCALALCCLLSVFASPAFVFGQTVKINDDSAAAKIKANVQKRGVNEKKRVKVRKLDGTRHNGYISQVGDDSFEITNSKTKQTVSITYRDVAKISGGGLSGGAQTAIVVGAVAGVAVIVLSIFLKRYCNEASC